MLGEQASSCVLEQGRPERISSSGRTERSLVSANRALQQVLAFPAVLQQLQVQDASFCNQVRQVTCPASKLKLGCQPHAAAMPVVHKSGSQSTPFNPN